MITSDSDDTLESILQKIQTPKDLNGKMGVYLMFKVTKFSSINEINTYIKHNDPELWNEIRRKFYPNLIDKIKNIFGSN